MKKRKLKTYTRIWKRNLKKNYEKEIDKNTVNSINVLKKKGQHEIVT